MHEYVVIRRSDRAEVYRYSSVSPVELAGFEFATHEHLVVPPASAPTPSQPSKPWHITKRSFWNRFPQTKLLAMRAVILQGHPILLAATLEMGRSEVESSPFVDLDLENTRNQTLMLSTNSVPETIMIDGTTLPLRLTQNEVSLIIDTPPTETERFKGVV